MKEIGKILVSLTIILVAIILASIRINKTEEVDKSFQEYLDSTYGYSVIESAKDSIESNAPIQEEIEAINAELPALVSEGMLFTKVVYDENTKVQTFYYEFTKEVDESLITTSAINQEKNDMIVALRGTKNEKKIKAGVTDLYVYKSLEDKTLYEIKIDSTDL